MLTVGFEEGVLVARRRSKLRHVWRVVADRGDVLAVRRVPVIGPCPDGEGWLMGRPEREVVELRRPRDYSVVEL